MKRSSSFDITIIGLGLIGGSLAAACRRAFPGVRIVGVTRSRRALAVAKKKGWIHEGTTDLHRGLRSAQLVVLCTPVDTLKNFLKQIDRLARPGTVVTDAGSVKGFLVRWAERQNWQRLRFVGAHPLAGSHERGIEYAKPDLFTGALTFLTPGRRASPQALGLVKKFWKKISRRVAVVSPERHDRITAEISHLPHLIAALLLQNASSNSLRFSASGFLDTTRIAQGDPRLWVPILLGNRRELLRSVLRLEAHLKRLKKILQRGDLRGLTRTLAEAQRRRLAIE